MLPINFSMCVIRVTNNVFNLLYCSTNLVVLQTISSKSKQDLIGIVNM